MIQDKLIDGRTYWVCRELEQSEWILAILDSNRWFDIDSGIEIKNTRDWLLIPTAEELIAQRKAMLLLKAQKDLPPEVNEIVNKRFWDLMEEV